MDTSLWNILLFEEIVIASRKNDNSFSNSKSFCLLVLREHD